MSDQHFLSAADAFGPLHGGERVMWQGRCGVAEYAFDEAASLPRWTLPEATDVLVTDHRVLYAYTAEDGGQVRSGELRWLWPQHLRVQPGARSRDRGAAATQIQLVCGGADGSYPALVFAGGDLATVGDADRVANVIRQAIARFRVDNAEKIGLTIGQTRMLSRLLIGPEFRNHQGGEGQTVSLLGALLVNRPAPVVPMAAPPAPSIPLDAAVPVAGSPPRAAPAPAAPAAAPSASPSAASASAAASGSAADVPAQSPSESGTRLAGYRPGLAADAARALMAAKAEEVAHVTEPDTAYRAADLAARVASLVSRISEPAAPSEPASWSPDGGRTAPEQDRDSFYPGARPAEQDRDTYPGPRHAESRTAADVERFEAPTPNLATRAEAVRRTAARMAANSARNRGGTRRADREPGVSTPGDRTS